MENQLGKVYLGYEDESIGENNHSLINYTVNKIGGLPDWPPHQHVQFPSKCPLCGLYRLLLLQCYAPLENSIYHRTLYIFACINPNCWNQSESWACVRSQFEDKSTNAQSTVSVAMPTVDHSNSSWCNGADEWDENDNGDTANGNFMNIDNAPSPKNGVHRNSDEDDESNSIEIDTIEQAMGNLQVFDAHNANMSPVQGAVGAVGLPVAVAELEGGDEPGLVTVDSPIAPNKDIQALLYQTAELPPDLRSRLQLVPLQFLPKFVYVEEEWQKQAHDDDKINELINKYKKENAEIEVCGAAGDRGGAGALEDESYEDVAPLHGDKMFHAFLTRLRKNPGQILRYSRGAPPLIGAPLMMAGPRACPRCGSHLICELQLVPEFSETLRLPPNNQLPYLHFLSVLVFTCSQSCWQPGDTFVQETILFQPEVV